VDLEPITRESKKAKVREAIINAAIALFEQHGYEQTTVRMIAAAAEVSPRTFFRYFPTKDLVVFPLHSSYVAEFKDLLSEKRPGQNPLETVRFGLSEMARLYQESAKEHLRYQRIISSSPNTLARSIQFDSDWENAIADVWKASCDLTDRQVHQANLIAGIIMGAIHVVMEKWYSDGCREDLSEMGETALDFVENGILENRLIYKAETVGKTKKGRAS